MGGELSESLARRCGLIWAQIEWTVSHFQVDEVQELLLAGESGSLHFLQILTYTIVPRCRHLVCSRTTRRELHLYPFRIVALTVL